MPSSLSPTEKRARLYAYGLSLVVFALDRLTKTLVRAYLPAWDSHTLIPGVFNLIHTENPGAAFSLFSDAHTGLRTFLLVAITTVAMIVVATLLWQAPQRRGDSTWLRAGLALILGGALGNLWDRVLRGEVTDFLELYLGQFRWPAFNVADSAITLGAVLVLLTMLRSRHAPEPT